MDYGIAGLIAAAVAYVVYILYRIVRARRALRSAEIAESAADFRNWICVEFNYGKETIKEMHAAQDALEKIVDPSGLGIVDGNEIAVDLSTASFWIACKDTGKILDLILPIITAKDFFEVTAVKKRNQDEEEFSVIWTPSV